MTQTISEELADYITRMKISDLPTEVVSKTKQCILDTIGCMLRGSLDEVGVMLVGHVFRYGPPGPCTVFGHAGSLGVEHAALANGTLAHVLEWDDGHRPSGNHLGCAVVPAAMVMAQATECSGDQILLSVALGYDVAGRVGEAVCLPRTGQYFHGNGTAGVFGTAAVAGKMLNLNALQVANALGIAGDGASGLREFPAVRGMQCKPLHVGRAVQTGVTAGLLAAEGFEGAATILEGRYGFCNAMTPEPRPELICLDLGQRFAVVESGFKYFAGGGGPTHVEAALWLREKYDLDPSSISRIKVGLPRSDGNRSFSGYLEDTMNKPRPPASVGHARFSTSYRVAAALSDGEMTHRQLSPVKLTDPTILSLEKLVEFDGDPDVQEIANSLARDEAFAFVPSSVEIDCGGQTYKHLVKKPLGYDIERALTQEQVETKFHSVVRGILSQQQADGVVNWVAGLDRGSQVKELAAILA